MCDSLVTGLEHVTVITVTPASLSVHFCSLASVPGTLPPVSKMSCATMSFVRNAFEQ